MKIYKNMVKCCKCGDILESKTEKDLDWCSCKSIAISGGKTQLRRYTATDKDEYEEMSKYVYDNPDSVEFM